MWGYKTHYFGFLEYQREVYALSRECVCWFFVIVYITKFKLIYIVPYTSSCKTAMCTVKKE